MSSSLDKTNPQSWASVPSDRPGSNSEVTTDGQMGQPSGASCPVTLASLPNLAGARFGDYELLEEVARGGMGVVYKARQETLCRTVALKMILEGQLASEDSVRRFYQEARSAAALDHPCIVPIYEIGQCEGRHFFTMAFIEGTTLTRRVRTHGVPAAAEAAALMLGIVDAVAYAHRRGVIHRDLKPDNVLIDQEGRPRVTDFGLAKSMTNEAGLTSAGQIMGTPAYMAPEQAWGKVHLMGPATDIYALGGILYFLLTGRPPFDGESTMEVLTQVTNRMPTAPRQFVPRVASDLEAICMKCLEKEPANRYSSAEDMAAALRNCGDLSTDAPTRQELAVPSGLIPTSFEVPTPSMSVQDTLQAHAEAPPPAPPRRRGAALAALVVLAVALVAGGALLAWQHFRSNDPAKAQAVFVEPKRHDFEVKLEIPDSVAGDKGERRLVEKKPVKFSIQVERDAYVGLWNIYPDGKIVQFFPNKFEEDNFVRAGKPRIIPGGKYKIEAELSEGMERIWVMASTTPWDVAAGEEKGPYKLFQTLDQQKDLESKVRGFLLKPANDDGPQISETALKYQVVKETGGR
jgi:serine/threonine protein kinase